jgi:hypothetical protein
LTERINELEKQLQARTDPPEARVPVEGRVTAVAGEIDLVVLSAGKDAGFSPGREVWIYRGEELVGRAAVERAEATWSSARTRERRKVPRVGDEVRDRPR